MKFITTKQRIEATREGKAKEEDRVRLEIYTATLAGFHANLGANSISYVKLADKAIWATKSAMRVWREDERD